MKKDLVQIERKLTAMAMEEMGYDDAKLDAIHERARQRYMAAKPEEPAPKKKSLGRKALVAVCAALALMVLSVVYTLAFPVEVGKANSFAKRVTVWVNGVLGREYEVEVPFEDENRLTNGEYWVSNDVNEIADEIDNPLFVMNENMSEYSLREASVACSEGNMMSVSLEYSNENQVIKIINQIGLHDQSVMYIESAEEIITDCGKMYVWISEEGVRGVVLSETGVIQIKTNLTQSEYYDIIECFYIID